MKKYECPAYIKDLRIRANNLSKILSNYKGFYRKRLNDKTWRETALRRQLQYYQVKAELNLIYIILRQHNELKKMFGKLRASQRFNPDCAERP